MPIQELPGEFLRPIESPSNSSLSSNSSDVILINAHYVRNSRSGSVSSTTTNSTQDESLESNLNIVPVINRTRSRAQNEVEEEELMYQPIKLPTEPTLEELLVRLKSIFKVAEMLTPLLFKASNNRQRRNTLSSANKTENNIIRH